jgi:FKBP-type peptidyl-prolyl cis-trans isomerase
MTGPQEPAMSEPVNELIVEDITEGQGAECPQGATVNVHYKGTLMDGTVFDSSYDRGQPIDFPLANLIPGWQQGIPGMKVGGKRKLTIPYNLAYGERVIPPRADLVFEIELLGVR